MKIAITTTGEGIEADIDPRFGRAKGFIIYDDETGKNNYINNEQNLNAPQGAGIQSAKNIIDSDAEVLLSGNVGPKAFSTLKSADIKIMVGIKGSVQDAIDDYKNGKLKEADNANVESHW
jgi:predicted Fe-Mo cluster-binding NifX family protein